MQGDRLQPSDRCKGIFGPNACRGLYCLPCTPEHLQALDALPYALPDQ